MTTGYLLDTNAISEASKKEPDAGFIEWFTKTDELTMFTSCIVLGEIKKGVSLIRDEARHEQFDALLAKLIVQFDSRIVNVDSRTALLWGELLAMGQLSGQTPPLLDALIAAQCITQNLILVTRNVRDFKQFAGIKLHNPWVG
jgi:toxin FitB